MMGVGAFRADSRMIEKRTIKGYLMAFGKGFAVALARQKDPAMGEAVNEAFRKAESEEGRKSDE